MKPRIFKSGRTWTLLYSKKAYGPVVVPADSFEDARTRLRVLYQAGYVHRT